MTLKDTTQVKHISLKVSQNNDKCLADSPHGRGEYHLALEDKDFCYQRLLSAKEVVNLANWLDVACRNIINLRSKNVTCSTMTLMLDKNIKLEIEYQCNDQLQSQYETMFSISFDEISMLFNVTASRDFKALALASKELLRGYVLDIRSPRKPVKKNILDKIAPLDFVEQTSAAFCDSIL